MNITEQDQPVKQSAGDILRAIVADIQAMIRGEMRLAKAEISEKVMSGGRAAGFFAAAAGSAFLAAMAFVATCIVVINLVLPLWLSALIMSALLAGLAGGLYLIGRASLPQPVVPRATVQSIEDTAQWAKRRMS